MARHLQAPSTYRAPCQAQVRWRSLPLIPSPFLPPPLTFLLLLLRLQRLALLPQQLFPLALPPRRWRQRFVQPQRVSTAQRGHSLASARPRAQRQRRSRLCRHLDVPAAPLVVEIIVATLVHGVSRCPIISANGSDCAFDLAALARASFSLLRSLLLLLSRSFLGDLPSCAPSSGGASALRQLWRWWR